MVREHEEGDAGDANGKGALDEKKPGARSVSRVKIE